jgi:hypothetical protein
MTGNSSFSFSVVYIDAKMIMALDASDRQVTETKNTLFKQRVTPPSAATHRDFIDPTCTVRTVGC